MVSDGYALLPGGHHLQPNPQTRDIGGLAIRALGGLLLGLHLLLGVDFGITEFFLILRVIIV